MYSESTDKYMTSNPPSFNYPSKFSENVEWKSTAIGNKAANINIRLIQ